MGEDTPSHPVPELAEDPEARLEYLVEAGVLELEGEAVTTTAAYEDTRSIYADTYAEDEVEDDEIVDTIVELFDVEEEAAREQFEAGEVTRHDVVTYLSLRSFLERELPIEILALLTEIVAQVGFGSPVPEGMRELSDEDYREFIDAAGDAVVFVWKYPCDPCRRMKGEVPRLLEQLPDTVAVAGVDGESVVEFRREFEPEAAPAVLLFADGELVETLRGYTAPADLVEALGEVYEDVAVDVVDPS